MATITQLVDDLDGAPADETVTYSLDGVAYEIDLTSGNAKKFRESFEPWTSRSRRVGGKPAGAGKPKPQQKQRPVKRSRRPRPTHDLAAIRSWAAEAGIAVSPRGRVPAAVIEQYLAAVKPSARRRSKKG